MKMIRLENKGASSRQVLPRFGRNLGWVIPALAGFASGMLIRHVKSKEITDSSEVRLTALLGV